MAASPTVPDLSTLTKLEKDVLKVMGPSSYVHRFEDFSKSLEKHGIRTLMDPADLKNFLKKRPKIFTVMEPFLWSRYSDIPGFIRPSPISPTAKAQAKSYPETGY